MLQQISKPTSFFYKNKTKKGRYLQYWYLLSFCYNWCCHVELLFMIIHYYYVVIFQFLVHAAALWSALHGLVGVLDVQICNNMINIQAGYLKYKYKYKWLYKYNILLPPLKLESLFLLFKQLWSKKAFMPNYAKLLYGLRSKIREWMDRWYHLWCE